MTSITESSFAMRSITFLSYLLSLLSITFAKKIDADLKSLLSPESSIVHSSSSAPRWSDYKPPKPGTIVNVATESDVVATVKYCNENKLDFMAQTGGHGWVSTFTLQGKDVIINMRGLNNIKVDKEGMKIEFGGGALIKEVVEAAFQNGVETITGNCNCVGTMGAALGGGIGRMQGLHGLSVDNILSLRLLTADGTIHELSPTSKEQDLWWAIRGAGHNFGIVLSATLKAYPQTNNGNAFIGNLIYEPEKIEQVSEAIEKLEMRGPMSVHFIYALNPADNKPSVIVVPWYMGTPEMAKEAFKPLLDLNPVVNDMNITAYNRVNDGTDSFCQKGGRKPAVTVGMNKLPGAVFRDTWNDFTSFIETHGVEEAGQTSMLVECYSYEKPRTIDAKESAFPHRNVNYLALLIPNYKSTSTDDDAKAFSSRVRDRWVDASGFEKEKWPAYLNFASGDEPFGAIYGYEDWRKTKLLDTKKKYDPEGRFNQYWPLGGGRPRRALI